LARSTAKLATPEQRIRDLAKEFRGFDREEPGPERAERLAGFTRAANDARQLNMAMQAATMCLEDDPDAPAMLVRVYAEADEDLETRLGALSDLVDLARYIERDDVRDAARERLEDTARTWVKAGDDGERRYRLRTVQSVTTREFADELRDELRKASNDS
jgi:hypothetical protein